MSDDESDPYNFHKSRQDEETAILYRLDERTERIDGRIERIDNRVEEHGKRLDSQENRIQRNQTIINAVTFGFGSFVTAIMAKLSGFIRFF